MTSSRSPAGVAAVLFALAILSGCSSANAPQRAQASGPGTDAELGSVLDRTLKRGQTAPGYFVARVVELKTGRELYAVDADKPVMPASNGKLAVSAAVLDFFGPDHAFKTYLARDGDDLWVIGTGDPGLGDNTLAKAVGDTTMSVLDRWAEALASRGVTHFGGHLYYYDRALDDQRTHPTWSRGYITDWYAAPVSGLNFNNNCIDVSVRPTKEGEPVDYTVVPPTKGVQIINDCKTGQGEPPDVTREMAANVFTIRGATTKPVKIKSEAVVDPGAFFADALRTHLASKGITVAGETRRADRPLGGQLEPPGGKILAVHETKLSDGLGRVNKQSQNNFAEAYCKLLGRAYRQKQGKDEPGSWPAGSEATLAFLHRNVIDTTGYVCADGSGLSRENRVTARVISELLATMWSHPQKRAWFDSLSIAYQDGTISRRLPDLKGRVRAKTGYIGGVRSLSGYVKTDAGDWLAFSIIYNGFRGSEKPYEDMQDNAVRVLAAWPKIIPAPPPTPTTSSVAAAR